ncbi:MAG: lysophospholipid acyltransferase family protein [Deltaproteobacteria bacterium]|nr:lysophospholipid acyltransferase family protein [Deltaproteobacteria bacterium]MBW2200307.1 lysophospholipid acyltransferase family protein [Deltaproteobacteria bacterium]MBW2539875.1 lysophospholipid acyltransferase family protein [Deltaproteobacteria bacterium]
MKPLKYAAYYLFGWISRVIATLLFSTCRITAYGQAIEKQYLRENPDKGLLYASWHRGVMFFVYFYRFLNFIVMASASDDGEIAAQATKRFGWIPVRGSSTRHGRLALREMEAYFDKGYRGGLVVDAPQGPRCVSKIGIIMLAKRTGLPIIPVIWGAERCWRLGSWDRTIIPKPFSRIVFLYANKFIRVPRDATREECDQLRQQLDHVLNTLMFQTDHFFRLNNVSDPRRIVVSDPQPE